MPSLPSQECTSYEPNEELYDEDGLYHRIEDVKAQPDYQNVRGSNLTSNIQETYDDVAPVNGIESNENYDDVHGVSKDNPVSYDNVKVIIRDFFNDLCNEF